MNPLSQTGNGSAEAARARELAELVHKTKLGAHTEHTSSPQKPASVKVFDTQKPVATPLQRDAQTILQSAQLADPLLEHNAREFKNTTQQVTLQSNAAVPTQPEIKPIERISENASLASHSAVLHTLNQDVQSLVTSRKVSMIRAVALESDKDASVARFAPQINTPRSLGSTLSILAVLCGIFAIGIIGAGLYIRAMQTKTVPIVAQARYDSALVFFEHSQPFDVSDLADFELIGGLAHLRDTVPSSLGSMTSVDMYSTRFDAVTNSRTSSALPLVTFIDQARLNMGDALKRSLGGDYMLLVHQGEAPTPVLLLRATEPDAAFAGMLAWESRMASSLSPLFPLGTLTLAESPPTFTDISFNNIDARVLYDGNQKIVLLYALLERNIIAITNSRTTMQEVASRLHTQLLKK
jgi:hypothetical protein